MRRPDSQKYVNPAQSQTSKTVCPGEQGETLTGKGAAKRDRVRLLVRVSNNKKSAPISAEQSSV